jgi:hypothetical protein
MSWECCMVVGYFKQKGDINSSNYKCLVEWNDINKTKSWVNHFALSLSNPIVRYNGMHKHRVPCYSVYIL